MIHHLFAHLPLNPIGVCNIMSHMKRLLEDIIGLYDQGYTLIEISQLTEQSVEDVDSVLTEYHENYIPIY